MEWGGRGGRGGGGISSSIPTLRGQQYQQLKVTSEDTDDHDDILAIGYRSNVYRDDEAAMAIDREEHMIKWNDDDAQDLWIDRYDVRALVDDARIFTRKKVQGVLSPEEEEEERMIDEFRYDGLPISQVDGIGAGASLPMPDRVATPEPDTSSAPRDEGAGPNQNAFHFSFGSSGGQGQHKEEVVTPAEIMQLALQVGMTNVALPKSRKQHQAIEKTARFVYRQGDKMEATLKVRHGGNPAFGFLLVDNPLQPYYQAIKSYLGSNPDKLLAESLLPPEDDKVPAQAAAPTAAHASDPAAAQDDDVTATNEDAVDAVEQGAEPPAETQPGEKRENDVFDAEAVAAAAVEKMRSAQSAHQQAVAAAPEPPTEEMRTALEKLVQWVAKNGREFESKVRERQRGEKRFDFLLPWSPYNAFYLKRLGEVEADLKKEKSGGATNDARGEESCKTEECRGEAAAALDEKTGSDNDKEASVDSSVEQTDAKQVKQAPVRVAITSFGGDDDGSEDEGAGETESNKDASGIEKKTRSEAGSGSSSEEKKEEPSVELTAEQKRAARLERAKLLAEKLQQANVTTASESPVIATGKTNDVRSRSASRDRSKSRGRRDESRSGRGKRDRSRSRSKGRRERSRDRYSRRDRSRDRDRDRRRSRSRSRDRRREHHHKSSRRSRSRERRRSRSRSRSRSRDRKRHKRHRRSRSRSRSASRGSSRRSRSKGRDANKESKSKDIAANANADTVMDTVVVSDELRSKVRALLGSL